MQLISLFSMLDLNVLLKNNGFGSLTESTFKTLEWNSLLELADKYWLETESWGSGLIPWLNCSAEVSGFRHTLITSKNGNK